MPRTITKITAHDVRFPTSRHLDGSDAMNQAPDYSAAYALIETDAGDGLVGHGMTFTIGRGNEVCATAIEALAPLVVGRTPRGDHRRHGRVLAQRRRRQPAALDRPGEGRDPPRHRGDRQRRLGPVGQGRGQAGLEAARRHDARGGRALHRLPLHHRRADAGRGACTSCGAMRPSKREREREMRARGYPGLHHVGRLARLLRREAARASAARRSRQGWTHFKQKVGADIEDDLRRARIIREEIGYDRT